MGVEGRADLARADDGDVLRGLEARVPAVIPCRHESVVLVSIAGGLFRCECGSVVEVLS